ncbi:restriction endonuclease [bacterium AH-315-J04]|nr:restriction endonuclease [bacterium AH-315-J04]
MLLGQTPMQRAIGFIVGSCGSLLVVFSIFDSKNKERRQHADREFKDLIRYEKVLRAYKSQLSDWTSERYSHELAFQKEREERDRAIHAEKMRARRMMEDFWRNLSGHGFEEELAHVFRDAGYAVVQTPTIGDAGVDLWIEKRGAKKIVQCKRYKKPVGVASIRDLYGTMTSFQVENSILASVSGFTSGAREFAKGKRIKLMDLQEIIQLQAKHRNKSLG